MDKLYSPLLVGAQILLMAAVLVLVPIPKHILGWGGILASVGLGLWAIGTMQRSKLNVFPDVRGGAHLVQAGPYRWIRHPMYTSVLGVTGAWAASSPSWLGLVLWGILASVLWTKLHYEERLLRRAFEGYEAYRTKTKRLLPYLI